MEAGGILIVRIAVSGENRGFDVYAAARLLRVAEAVQADVSRGYGSWIIGQIRIVEDIAQGVAEGLDEVVAAVLLIAKEIPTGHLSHTNGDNAVSKLFLQPIGIHAKHMDAVEAAGIGVAA